MKQHFEDRVKILTRILEKNQGVQLSFGEVADKIREEGGEAALKPSQVMHCVRRLRARLPEPSALQVIGGNALILRSRETVFQRREKSHESIKTQIGNAALHFLFGKHSSARRSCDYFVPATWPKSLEPKLTKLRSKHGVSLLLDSGSSTRAVVKALLDTPTMPLTVRECPVPLARLIGSTSDLDSLDPEVRDKPQSLLPTLITNSPRVAVDVLESPFVDRFDVRLIGGTIRGQYGSVAGEFAESCLDSWGYVEGVVGFDVAILGATGVASGWGGDRAFGVEHLTEASSKARFLSACKVRCIVMDSSKLGGGDVACVFAAMNGKLVDIVITDNVGRGAADFAKEALKAGILPVVVRIDVDRSDMEFVSAELIIKEFSGPEHQRKVKRANTSAKSPKAHGKAHAAELQPIESAIHALQSASPGYLLWNTTVG